MHEKPRWLIDAYRHIVLSPLLLFSSSLEYRLQLKLLQPLTGNTKIPLRDRGSFWLTKVCIPPSGRDFDRTAFLDPGADGSVMKGCLANMLAHDHHSKPVGILESADGSHAPHYGIHSTRVKMTDDDGKTCCKLVHFAVMELPEDGTRVVWLRHFLHFHSEREAKCNSVLYG